MSIRHAIKQVVNGEEHLPLFHVDGELNLADLITKPRKLPTIDVTATSTWQLGLDWMRLPSDQLPSNQHVSSLASELDEVVSKEMFQDIEAHRAEVEARQMLRVAGSQDVVFSAAKLEHKGKVKWLYKHFDFLHLGWQRATSRLELVCSAVLRLRHRRHKDPTLTPNCPVCKGTLRAEVSRMVSSTLQVAASAEAEAALGSSKLSKQCTKSRGIWYTSRRLEKEGLMDVADLDFDPFYDGVTIKKVLPIMLVKSELFYSLLNHVHFRELPHAGVEPTLARIRQAFYPIGDPRQTIAKVKKACSKCRLMLKEVVGLELADIHPLRYTICPPFYGVMMDIAMGFKAKPYKDARRSLQANALVIVCLLTSATSIHVLDSLETQAVIMALERHASRYGTPAHVFVDAGTQLEKLKDTSFSLRDMSGGVAVSRSFAIAVATPKAHEAQGRVEAKIKIVRQLLQTLSDTSDVAHTLLGWETVFARIADAIDNLPIARGSSCAPTDLGWEVITPNRLKLGRNNFRNLEGTITLTGGPQTMLDRNRLLTERWYQLFIERIHLFIPGPKSGEYRTLAEGDVVLFVFQDAGTPKMWVWRLGVVNRQVSRSTYEIRYSNQQGGRPKLIERDARHISLIYGEGEIPPTSRLFFK
jgi:hypothetical protein